MSEPREYMWACPECGAQPWVNIDCQLCIHVSGLEAERDRLAAVVGVARWERDNGLASPYLCRALAAIEALGDAEEEAHGADDD